MIISLAQTLLTCVKFWLLQVIKRDTFQVLPGYGDAHRLWSNFNKGMFQAFALVWQMAQNRRLHKTGGTYYQSCMYPTDSAWPAFLMLFLLLLPVYGHLSRGFHVPPTKRAYSALHPQALTKCCPLDFRRSSVATVCVFDTHRNTVIYWFWVQVSNTFCAVDYYSFCYHHSL